MGSTAYTLDELGKYCTNESCFSFSGHQSSNMCASQTCRTQALAFLHGSQASYPGNPTSCRCFWLWKRLVAFDTCQWPRQFVSACRVGWDARGHVLRRTWLHLTR